MKVNTTALSALLSLLTLASWSQSIIQPNYGLKNHETLVINKIETTTRATTIYLTVENRIQGGKFCADKNIFLVSPDGTRSKLVSSSGIPVCPETHYFKAPGEKLDFTLLFPPLKKGTEWIDIIEDCTDNCFHFYGVTLDSELNQRINEAFQLAEKDDPLKAMISFIDILGSVSQRNTGVEGLLYVNIISLARNSGNYGQASDWYKRFKDSGASRLEEYIKFLNNQGIRY